MSATISVRGHELRAPKPVPTVGRSVRRRTGTRGEVSEGRGFAPFRIRAGLDDRTVEELESALVRYCATTTGDVVVDGSDLERIDGSGLRTLLGVAHQLRPLGRRVVLCGFPASCGRAIDRAGLGQQRWLDDGREGPDAAAGDGTAGPSRSR